MAYNLQIDSVIKRYGNKTILTDVYLSIETAEIVAVFGRNGSGKSTLFKILYGIETAENCFIKLNNVPIKALFKKRTSSIIRHKNVLFQKMKQHKMY